MRLQAIHDRFVSLQNANDTARLAIPNEESAVVRPSDDVFAIPKISDVLMRVPLE